jgi:hypothetical protein
MALLVLRAVFEDRMLKRGLEGYMEYSKTVKYRLIPHVWQIFTSCLEVATPETHALAQASA